MLALTGVRSQLSCCEKLSPSCPTKEWFQPPCHLCSHDKTLSWVCKGSSFLTPVNAQGSLPGNSFLRLPPHSWSHIGLQFHSPACDCGWWYWEDMRWRNYYFCIYVCSFLHLYFQLSHFTNTIELFASHWLCPLLWHHHTLFTLSVLLRPGGHQLNWEIFLEQATFWLRIYPEFSSVVVTLHICLLQVGFGACRDGFRT